MNKLIFLSLLLLFCKSQNNVEQESFLITGEEELIELDTESVEKIRMSSIFEKPELIYLKTPENLLIGRISKIIYQNGKIILFDKPKNTIWVFNLDGQYISHIEIPIGSGPGELQHITDIDFTPDNNIYALGAFKIVGYDLEGKNFLDVTTEYMMMKFSFDESEQLFLGYPGGIPNAKVRNHEMNNLFIIDKYGKIIDSYLALQKGKEGLFYDIPNYFPRYKNEILFSPHLNDTVYSINLKGEIKTKYILDFKDRKIPYSVFEKRTKYGAEPWVKSEFMEEEIISKGYISHISTYEENDDYMLIRFGAWNENYLAIIEKKNNNKIITKTNFENDFFDGISPHIYTLVDNSILSYVQYYQFMEYYDQDSTNYLKKIANEFDGNENPILFRLKFK